MSKELKKYGLSITTRKGRKALGSLKPTDQRWVYGQPGSRIQGGKTKERSRNDSSGLRDCISPPPTTEKLEGCKKAEASGNILSTPIPIPKPNSMYSAWFEEFWSQYPRRQGQRRGKSLARSKWHSLLNGGSEKRAEKIRSSIMEALTIFKQDRQVIDGFPCDAVRFLKRYTDWLEDAPGSTTSASGTYGIPEVKKCEQCSGKGFFRGEDGKAYKCPCRKSKSTTGASSDCSTPEAQQCEQCNGKGFYRSEDGKAYKCPCRKSKSTAGASSDCSTPEAKQCEQCNGKGFYRSEDGKAYKCPCRKSKT